MSGSRLKKLRHQFKARFGRYPNKMEIQPNATIMSNIMAYYPSEIRRLKKAYNANR